MDVDFDLESLAHVEQRYVDIVLSMEPSTQLPKNPNPMLILRHVVSRSILFSNIPETELALYNPSTM